MSSAILLYHTGYQEIRHPDVRFGRRNADFGQGFYTTRDIDFAMRWAKGRSGSCTYVNAYALDLSGLNVYRFERNEAWFHYIFRNRAGQADTLPEMDIIIGPIANDTIYDTFGIITSGLLKREQSLQLLALGPSYEQTVIKSEKAAAQLKWLSSRILERSEIAHCRAQAAKEEADYQKTISEVLK